MFIVVSLFKVVEDYYIRCLLFVFQVLLVIFGICFLELGHLLLVHQLLVCLILMECKKRKIRSHGK